MDSRLLVKERVTNIGIPLDVFGFLPSNDFLHLDVLCIFRCLRTSLLYIVGELAVGKFVAVAVGVLDRRQVTRDTNT